MKLKISPFAWVSFAMIVGVMGTALITPLYGLYQQQWHLLPSDVSFIYVVYMGGALGSTLFLGRLSDRIGFLRVMLAGLALILLGNFLTMVAWNVASLSVGRCIVGVASGLLTTSSTIGLTSLAAPGQTQRAATAASFLMAFGFGLGPLLGGITGQWAPAPLVTSYIVPLVLCAVGLFALWRLKLPAGALSAPPQRLQWRDVLPTLTWPARADSSAFVLTCTLPFLAFGVFGLYAAMAPLFLDKLVPWHGPVVGGTAIAVILFASACVQVLTTRVPSHQCGAFGLWGMAISNAVLMVNLWVGSATLFVLGVACTAVGHGLSMQAGMRLMNRIATPATRAGLLATYLVIGYIGSMLPMMAMGWIADHWGMDWAVNLFCGLVIVLSCIAAVLFLRHPRIQTSATS